MTVAVTGDGIVLDQIEKQIHKLENVIDVEKLSGEASVCRELILVKVAASREERPSINAIVEIFRAKIVDVAADSMMIELTGNQAKLNAFTKLLDGYEIKELVRTGITGLTRGFLTEQA